MSIWFIVPLTLFIALVSYVAWRLVGDGVLLLVERAGARRTRVMIGALAVVVFVGAAGGAWYFAREAKQTAVEVAEGVAAVPAPAVEQKVAGGDLSQLVDRLDARLKREPDDVQGWALFARTQLELQRYPGAARAYAKATAMLPNDVDLQVERANAELMANGRQWNQAAIDATEAALNLNPDHLEALWLAGTYRFLKKDYTTALGHWEKLVRIAPANSDYARDLATTMVEARALRDGKDPAAAIAAAGTGARPLPATGLPASNTASASVSVGVNAGPQSNDKAKLARELQERLNTMGGKSSPPATVASKNHISGEIRLQPSLRAEVSPDATVFVFARAENPDKTRTPLAAKRYRVADLPVQFDLSDNDAMSPELKLSSFAKIIVVARVSKSGDARAQAGDLEGASQAVAVGAEGISVLINRAL